MDPERRAHQGHALDEEYDACPVCGWAECNEGCEEDERAKA